MKLLAVADLHFEKGSSFARRGQMLPPYDTRETLSRLARLVDRLSPTVIVALGDSFHDDGGPARLDPRDRETIAALQRGRDIVWIAGNHDPSAPAGLPGSHADLLAVGPLTFRHEPAPGAAFGEIAGHLHPAARVAGRGKWVRRRCFAGDGLRHALATLDARSRRIVEQRWLEVDDDGSGGRTLHDLAAEYGVSAERIRQIEVAAMKKMRKAMAAA